MDEIADSRGPELDAVPSCAYDPVTCCLIVNERAELGFPLLEIFRRHGQRCLKWLNPAYQDQAPGDFPQRTWTTIEKNFLGRLAHEEDHHYRHLYTSYGMLRQRISVQHMEAAVTRLKLAVPADRSTRPQLKLLRLLDGGRRSANAEKNFGDLEIPHSLGLEIDWQGDYKAYVPTDSNYILGASAMFEALAISREITLVRAAMGQNEVWRDQLNIRLPLMEGYNRARHTWNAVLSDPLVKFPAAHRAWNHISNRKVQPMEFYLAADLALWIPFFPKKQGKRYTWKDVHPGWRFRKIVEYFELTKTAWAPPDSFPGTFNAKHIEIQNNICAFYSWPTPEELTAVWLEHMTAPEPVMPMTSLEYFDQRRQLASADLLRIHRTNPANTCYGVFGGSRGPRWFPIAQFRDCYVRYGAEGEQAYPHPFALATLLELFENHSQSIRVQQDQKVIHDLINSASIHLSYFTDQDRQWWKIRLKHAVAGCP